ncbi:MAG: hypothetical protein HC880_03245 [Bacteroidia bacterium]|nr:hypothetical protein [Bacteroidia bacterium]
MVGQTVNYHYTADQVQQYGGKNKAETPAGVNPGYSSLPKEEKEPINNEIDQRYYEGTGINEGEKIRKGEQAKIDMWNLYRDQVIAERQAINALPERLKMFLKGGRKEFDPKDYAQLKRIVDKLTPEQWNDYMNRVSAKTTDLDVLEQSVQAFKERIEQRKVDLKKLDHLVTKLHSLEEVYKLYKQYKQMAPRRGGTIVPTMAGGVYVPPTQQEIDEIDQLENTLLNNLQPDFASIAEFEQHIHDYEAAFRKETVAIANDMLDYYENLLYREKQKYQDDQHVEALHNQLGGIRFHHQAVEDINRELAEIYREQNKRRTPNDFTPNEPEHITKRKQELTEQGKSHVEAAKEEAGKISVTDPLMREDYLPLNKRLNKVDLAKADKNGLKRLLLEHIEDRRRDIKQTRQDLAEDSLRVYGLDKLLAASYERQKIEPRSIYDLIISDKKKEEETKHLVRNIVIAVIAIAVGILTFGGGTVAMLAAAASLA